MRLWQLVWQPFCQRLDWKKKIWTKSVGKTRVGTFINNWAKRMQICIIMNSRNIISEYYSSAHGYCYFRQIEICAYLFRWIYEHEHCDNQIPLNQYSKNFYLFSSIEKKTVTFSSFNFIQINFYAQIPYSIGEHHRKCVGLTFCDIISI